MFDGLPSSVGEVPPLVVNRIRVGHKTPRMAQIFTAVSHSDRPGQKTSLEYPSQYDSGVP